MILTKFKAHSIKQIMKAHITNSDKVQNLREILKPFGLQDKLTNVYSPKQAKDSLNLSNYTIHGSKDKTIDVINNFIKDDNKPLSSKHYLILDNHELHLVNSNDIKKIEKQVIRLLKHSDK